MGRLIQCKGDNSLETFPKDNFAMLYDILWQDGSKARPMRVRSQADDPMYQPEVQLNDNPHRKTISLVG